MDMSDSLPRFFLDFLKAVKGKRSRIVIEHILAHGFITTEDLERTYGYKHPPRAIRDVREQGVPIESFTIKDSQGRSIAAYRFGDTAQVRPGRSGRHRLPKRLKKALYATQEGKCAVCAARYDERYLQVDHRVPYEVAGDAALEADSKTYMLLCASCNRAKSRSCEDCQNWRQIKAAAICLDCFWASPAQYQHIAMQPLRRLEILWTAEEVKEYEALKQEAENRGTNLSHYVKSLVRRHLSNSE